MNAIRNRFCSPVAVMIVAASGLCGVVSEVLGTTEGDCSYTYPRYGRCGFTAPANFQYDCRYGGGQQGCEGKKAYKPYDGYFRCRPRNQLEEAEHRKNCVLAFIVNPGGGPTLLPIMAICYQERSCIYSMLKSECVFAGDWYTPDGGMKQETSWNWCPGYP